MSNRLILSILAFAGLMLLSPIASAKNVNPPVDPGPQPDFLQAQSIAESTMRANFFDPGLAEFQWPFNWTGGYWKPVLQGKKKGWWTCGLVNAKNRMGGYVGFQNFAVVFYNGALVYYEVGTGQQYNFTNAICAKAVSQGSLPRSSGVQAPALDPSKPSLGIGLSSVPDGLYITTVLPQSVAEQAGLRAGMVVASVNGIALKGMPFSVASQILVAAQGEVTLDIIGRGKVSMTKALAVPLPR